MLASTENYRALKKRAIIMRKKGLSYREIKEKGIPVSKSTLSMWLRKVKISQKARSRLQKRMKLGQPYGARAQKRIRLEKTKKIFKAARIEIGSLNKREIFLMGTMLYWAEGTKQKKHNPSQRVVFNNSDPQMVKFFLHWLREVLKVDRDEIDFEIYSHENMKEKEKAMKDYWSNLADYPVDSFQRVRYKEDKKKIYRKNQGKHYHGLLRISVKKSTDLNRKIAGWIKGVCESV